MTVLLLLMRSSGVLLSNTCNVLGQLPPVNTHQLSHICLMQIMWGATESLQSLLEATEAHLICNGLSSQALREENPSVKPALPAYEGQCYTELYSLEKPWDEAWKECQEALQGCEATPLTFEAFIASSKKIEDDMRIDTLASHHALHNDLLKRYPESEKEKWVKMGSTVLQILPNWQYAQTMLTPTSSRSDFCIVFKGLNQIQRRFAPAYDKGPDLTFDPTLLDQNKHAHLISAGKSRRPEDFNEDVRREFHHYSKDINGDVDRLRKPYRQNQTEQARLQQSARNLHTLLECYKSSMLRMPWPDAKAHFRNAHSNILSAAYIPTFVVHKTHGMDIEGLISQFVSTKEAADAKTEEGSGWFPVVKEKKWLRILCDVSRVPICLVLSLVHRGWTVNVWKLGQVLSFYLTLYMCWKYLLEVVKELGAGSHCDVSVQIAWQITEWWYCKSWIPSEGKFWSAGDILAGHSWLKNLVTASQGRMPCWRSSDQKGPNIYGMMVAPTHLCMACLKPPRWAPVMVKTNLAVQYPYIPDKINGTSRSQTGIHLVGQWLICLVQVQGPVPNSTRHCYNSNLSTISQLLTPSAGVRSATCPDMLLSARSSN